MCMHILNITTNRSTPCGTWILIGGPCRTPPSFSSASATRRYIYIYIYI